MPIKGIKLGRPPSSGHLESSMTAIKKGIDRLGRDSIRFPLGISGEAMKKRIYRSGIPWYEILPSGRELIWEKRSILEEFSQGKKGLRELDSTRVKALFTEEERNRLRKYFNWYKTELRPWRIKKHLVEIAVSKNELSRKEWHKAIKHFSPEELTVLEKYLERKKKK